MPKISVIVPVYGVEECLDRSVQALLCQSFSDFELILVDDGSPDRSGEICEAWAEKDPRVVVYHKENGGVSDARNFGIDRARGDYLSFVDPDDNVAEDYLAYLYSLLEKNPGCLVSACNHYVQRGEKKKLNTGFTDVRVLSRKEAFLEVLYHGILDVSAWGKLYHRSVFEKIRFPKEKHYEDTYIFGEIIMSSDAIVFGGEAKYDYIQREGSIVGGDYCEYRNEFIEAVDKFCEDAMQYDSGFEAACLRRKMHADFSTLRYMEHCKEEYLPFRNILRERILKNAKAVVSDPKTPKRDRLAIYTLKMGFPVFFFAWRLYGKIR